MSPRKVLPIVVPDIVSYAHLTCFLSVLYSDPKPLKWVYSNYVQLHMDTASMFTDYLTPGPEQHMIPCLHGSQRIHRESIVRFSPSFVDFVRFQIDNGYYCWTYVNEYYIPNTFAFENQSFTHPLMIYGYDDTVQKFSVAGFFAQRKFGMCELPYESLEKAFKEVELPSQSGEQDTVILFKLHETRKAECEFRLAWVMEQLSDYLHSRRSGYMKGALAPNVPQGRVYGLDIYDVLRIPFTKTELLSDSQGIDHRPLYVLWEHKKMMNRRIAYMAEQGYFSFSDAVVEGYRKVEQEALAVWNLFLKFLMTRDARLARQIVERLGTLKEKDSLAIARMLDEYGAFNLKKEENAESTH